MKKLFLLLALCFLPKPVTAFAESECYACILLPNTYLYAAEDTTQGLFVLPQTYYVKVLEQGVTYCYVEYAVTSDLYQAVQGYCLTEELYFVDFLPERPFVVLTFPLTYLLEGYSQSMVSGIMTSFTRIFSYYGDYRIGSNDYCYVYANGEFGYVPKPAELSYELNYDYLPPSEEEPVEPEEPFLTEEKLEAVRVISIAVLSVVGVLALYLVLRLGTKKNKKQPQKDWYEES